MSDKLYDPSTSIGRIRLLIDDTEDINAPIFSDAELQAFLDLNGDSALRAAAQALLLIAGSEVRLGKKITSQDITVDGPAVAAELRNQAKQLRAQADEQDATDAAGAFEIVDYPYGESALPELTEPTW